MKCELKSSLVVRAWWSKNGGSHTRSGSSQNAANREKIEKNIFHQYIERHITPLCIDS